MQEGHDARDDGAEGGAHQRDEVGEGDEQRDESGDPTPLILGTAWVSTPQTALMSRLPEMWPVRVLAQSRATRRMRSARRGGNKARVPSTTFGLARTAR